MQAQEILIAVGILAVVLVALYAVAKGRGFKFAAQRGKTKLQMDISGKPDESPERSGESGGISDVNVLNHGKIEKGKANIHIGHNIKKKED